MANNANSETEEIPKTQLILSHLAKQVRKQNTTSTNNWPNLAMEQSISV